MTQKSTPITKDLSNLKYIITPAKVPKNSPDLLTLHNQLFDFWLAGWTEAFSKVDPDGPWQDYYLRQDVAVGLLDQQSNQVVGCHLYTFYNMHAHSTMESEYFKFASKESMMALQKTGSGIIMTMEFLCVAPEWKFNLQKVGLGKLLVALGTYVAELYGADASVGTPVAGTKVDKMAENVGAYTLEEGLPRHGFDTKLVVMPTRVPSQDLQVRELAQRFWDEKIDYVEHLPTSKEKQPVEITKKAA